MGVDSASQSLAVTLLKLYHYAVMKDLGKVLLSKIDAIIQDWIEAVRRDEEIETSKKLTYESVRNSLPVVLEAIATLLTESILDQPKKVEKNSLEHGVVRAEQGYDAAEIVHEYRLLRQVIFVALEPDLLTGSAADVLQAVRAIDAVLDEVIFLSLESYIEAQLNKLEEMQAQLILTNQELNRLVQSQKDNLSYLAHELKNPLNSIIGFSSLLLQKKSKEYNNSLNFQLIEKMLNNGKQLLQLVNNALEISRYEAGKIELSFKPVEIGSLIQAVIDTLEPSAHQKDLDLVVDLSQAPQQVLTDPLRVQQIITNLLSNAIRYTETGRITIICQSCHQDRWQLIVVDTGKGISPADQENIFQPYFRAGSQETYLPESTGLGLAIVAQLVNLLSGKIELVSQLGQGSTFTVTFPLSLDR